MTEAENAIRDRARTIGVIRRDLIKVLDYLDGDVLECKDAGRSIVLMFALCSMIYIHNMNRSATLALFEDILSKFDPDEVLPKPGDTVQ